MGEWLTVESVICNQFLCQSAVQKQVGLLKPLKFRDLTFGGDQTSSFEKVRDSLFISESFVPPANSTD